VGKENLHWFGVWRSPYKKRGEIFLNSHDRYLHCGFSPIDYYSSHLSTAPAKNQVCCLLVRGYTASWQTDSTLPLPESKTPTDSKNKQTNKKNQKQTNKKNTNQPNQQQQKMHKSKKTKTTRKTTKTPHGGVS